MVFRNNSISTGSGGEGRLDLARLFGNENSVEVDLGCGKGKFVANEAGERKDVNFIAIDRLTRKLKVLAMRIEAQGLDNIRMLRCDAYHFVRHLLPGHSISAFYIYFPDPWPKKRHGKHRFITADLVHELARVLVPEGYVRIMTDDEKYAGQIEESFEMEPRLERTDFFSSPTHGGTEFEEEFREKGADIFRMAYKKRPL